jgi:hypothetical protein
MIHCISIFNQFTMLWWHSFVYVSKHCIHVYYFRIINKRVYHPGWFMFLLSFVCTAIVSRWKWHLSTITPNPHYKYYTLINIDIHVPYYIYKYIDWLVFNANFSNISAISWRIYIHVNLNSLVRIKFLDLFLFSSKKKWNYWSKQTVTGLDLGSEYLCAHVLCEDCWTKNVLIPPEFKDKNFNTFGQFSVWLAYFAYSSLIR